MLSALVVIAGLVIRRKVEETPKFRDEQARHEVIKAPIVSVLRESWADVLRAIGMTLVNVVGTTVAVFGAAYATQKATASG